MWGLDIVKKIMEEGQGTLLECKIYANTKFRFCSLCDQKDWKNIDKEINFLLGDLK